MKRSLCSKKAIPLRDSYSAYALGYEENASRTLEKKKAMESG